jgi:hypothetical protein
MSNWLSPGTWYARERGCICPDMGTITGTQIIHYECPLHRSWVTRQTYNTGPYDPQYDRPDVTLQKLKP